jgi:hypothetical protein
MASGPLSILARANPGPRQAKTSRLTGRCRAASQSFRASRHAAAYLASTASPWPTVLRARSPQRPVKASTAGAPGSRRRRIGHWLRCLSCPGLGFGHPRLRPQPRSEWRIVPSPMSQRAKVFWSLFFKKRRLSSSPLQPQPQRKRDSPQRPHTRKPEQHEPQELPPADQWSCTSAPTLPRKIQYA